MQKKMTITISIIGTAGRDNQYDNHYTVQLYEKMQNEAKIFIDHVKMISKSNSIELVSGGAAFSDHIAVSLYLENYVENLTLYLPCGFIDNSYYNNGINNWQSNPGKITNFYHSKFSRHINIDSLNQIKQSIEKGAKVDILSGFHARNTKIAKSQYLLAYSWTRDVSGGTKDTWNKASHVKEKKLIHLMDLI